MRVVTLAIIIRDYPIYSSSFVTLLEYQNISQEMVQRRVITSLIHIYSLVKKYLLRIYYDMNRMGMFDDLQDEYSLLSYLGRTRFNM